MGMWSRRMSLLPWKRRARIVELGMVAGMDLGWVALVWGMDEGLFWYWLVVLCLD